VIPGVVAAGHESIARCEMVVAPVIEGEPVVGATLVATPGEWGGSCGPLPLAVRQPTIFVIQDEEPAP
jgi:hypothetical protein